MPCALAVLLGSSCGREAIWCPTGLGVLLLAAGLALWGEWGRITVFLALGLIAGAMSLGPSRQIDVELPVVLGVTVEGDWRDEYHGLSATGQTRWVRQGLYVSSWSREVRLLLPAGGEPPESRRLRVKGFLRRAAPLANGVASQAGRWSLRIKSDLFVESVPRALEGPSRYWIHFQQALRGRLQEELVRVEEAGSGWGASLVRTLVLGQQDSLSPAAKRGLRAAGLAHLVALSGLHVGLLVGMTLIVTAFLPVHWRFAVASLMALSYVVLAGARPSLLRATLMGLALMVTWTLRRQPRPINVLSWVAGSMLVVDPALAGDLGFQLTVVATGGILLIAPALDARWDGLPKKLSRPLSVSVAAYLVVIPWSWSKFCLVTPLSPVWNLLAVPWTSVALGLAFVWVFTLWTVPPLGDLLVPLLDCTALPLKVFEVLTPRILGTVTVRLEWWVAVAAAVGLIMALLAKSRWTRGVSLVLVAAILAWEAMPRSQNPEMILLDVGQGDAIVLRDGNEVFLVDGGGWSRADIAGQVLVPTLSSLGIHRLQGMMLSHPDTDHCNGLLGLVSYLPIGRLYVSAGWKEARCVDKLLAAPGIESLPLWRGEELELGRWRIKVLHPGAAARQGRNDRSLVIQAETLGRRVLLTGDLGSPGERRILEALEPRLASVDILKVGHHGSDSSTTAAWLGRLRPSIALISCGTGNRYGHPSPRVLGRLNRSGARVLRTDVLGMIRISFLPGGKTRLSLPGQLQKSRIG